MEGSDNMKPLKSVLVGYRFEGGGISHDPKGHLVEGGNAGRSNNFTGNKVAIGGDGKFYDGNPFSA